MSKKQKDKTRKIPLHITVLTIIAYVASLLVVGFEYIIPQTHDLTVGMVSPLDFNAGRQAENIYLTNIERDAAAAAVSTVFQMDHDITNEILSNVEIFFTQIGALRAQNLPILSPFAQDEAAPFSEGDILHEINVDLTPHQLNRIITDSSATFAHFRSALTQEIQNMLDAQIPAQAGFTGFFFELEEHLLQQFDEVYSAIGGIVARSFVVVNMVPNEAETERGRQEARDAVTPIMIQIGQSIVRAGDVIDEEAYMSLVELGFIGGNFALVFSGVAGSFLAVTIIFAIAIFYIHLFMKEMAFDKKQFTLLFTLYMMVLVLMRIMVPLPFYFTPIMLFAMLCSILIDMRLSAVLSVAVSIIAVIMDPMNTMFITYAVINGILAAMIAKRIIVRANMWSAAAAFVLVNALTVFANYLIFGAGLSNQMLMSAVLAMVGGVMTITITYGSLPLWESLFKVVTQNTLLELTDPNNALLRRLLIETPGTYHHSLVVANLAEAACYDIGANHVLARIGAYYHDIGKMKYPQYFAENQTESNP
ncbi:MAG: HDIG domain-containing protein, partial [Defluviitaleaceae bacterium]|nr:HDIG domain-containing protein [Defluviitaleaceae bacterium]